MSIRSAEFTKGIVLYGDDGFEDYNPQIAFIGRSNVGKSSVINTLTKQKNLAKTSSFPGSTREINFFLINKSFYLTDLPGYGFAKASKQEQKQLWELINWYLFESPYKKKKIVLIIDASIDAANNDLEMLRRLEEKGNNIIIVANKVDKIKKTEYKKQLQKIQDIMGIHKIIPYSSKKRIGISDLTEEILK